MPELVALDLPGGPAFLDALRRTWDAGDAVAPLDPSAPAAWRAVLLGVLAPTILIGPDGERTRLAGGRPVEPGDALVMATSGSSGTPKAAVLTHRSLEFGAFASSTALGTDPAAHWLACLPLHHIGGFSVLTRALHTGAGLSVWPRFDAGALESAADDITASGGAPYTSLVPTALRRVDAGRFRRILLGGSAIPADRPANTVATYGMTETGAGIVYDGLALNGVHVEVDAVGRGQVGEILIDSPTLLRCYRDGTEPFDGRGRFATGDLGRIDPTDGRLQVLGRRGDVINSGGEKVWPEPVEALLREHPGVAEVAVVGLPDAEWGQAVTAVVVPRDANEPPGIDALRELVRRELPAHAAPRRLELVDRLPRTSLGKIRRGELRDRLTERHPRL